jgi:hypothetical protein
LSLAADSRRPVILSALQESAAKAGAVLTDERAEPTGADGDLVASAATGAASMLGISERSQRH